MDRLSIRKSHPDYFQKGIFPLDKERTLKYTTIDLLKIRLKY